MEDPSASEVHFQADKRRVLSKVDLSKKGSVDEPIRHLIGYINAQDCVYSTSSCSGRVSLFSEVGRYLHCI